MADKYLLTPASSDMDEDEGMTKTEILKMLARELGFVLKRPLRLSPKMLRQRRRRK